MRLRKRLVELGKSLTATLPDPANFQGIIAACCIGLILGYAIQVVSKPYPGFPFGGPADFTIFYTAAHIIRAGQGAQLYDLALQAKVQQSFLRPHGWVMENGLLPYNYPPFGALLYVPFSFLPLQLAFHVWNAVNICLVLACVRLLRHSNGTTTDRKTTLTISLAVFSFYPVFRVFWNGQSTLLIVLCLVLSYVWLRTGREALAGMAMAFGLLKPQLVIVLLLVLMYRRRWRFLLGFAATSLVLLVVSTLLVGRSGLRSYIALGTSMPYWDGFGGMVPTFMVNIRGTVARVARFLASHFGTAITSGQVAAVTALLSLPLTVLVLYLWRGPWNTRSARFQVQYALTIVGSVLLSFHLYDYDVSLLVIAAFLISGYFASRGELKTALLLICAGHLGHFLPWVFFGKVGWAQAVQIVILILAIPLIQHARPAGPLPVEIRLPLRID